MSNVKKIEAEGQELILRNEAGDVAIIPGKYRREVMDMLDEECYNCVDALVGTLPVMADYAENGTVVADDEKPKEGQGKIHVLVESPKMERHSQHMNFKEYSDYVERKYYGGKTYQELVYESTRPDITQERYDEIQNILTNNEADAYSDTENTDLFNKFLTERQYQPYVKDAPSNFFMREANRIKNNFSDVSVTQLYNQPAVLDSVLSSVKPNDKIVILGHNGSVMLGMKNENIADLFNKSIKDKTNVECLLGTCQGSELLLDYSRSEIPVYGYKGPSWYIPFDKGTDLKEMMYGWGYESNDSGGKIRVVKKPVSDYIDVIKNNLN